MFKKLFIMVCVILLLGVCWIKWNSAQAVSEELLPDMELASFQADEEELFYDDGSPESSWTGGAAGWEMAVCFTPTQYPCTLKTAKFFMTAVGFSFILHVRSQETDTSEPGLDKISSFLVQPSITGWYTYDMRPFNATVSSGNFTVGIEFNNAVGPAIGSDTSPPLSNRSWVRDPTLTNWVLWNEDFLIRAVVEYPTPTTTTAPPTTVPTTIPTTTTTQICPPIFIYGEDSEEVELLRYFRDEVLSKTPEGQELIRLYYEWSPVIIEAMEEDEEFKEEVKALIDETLTLITTE